MQTTSQEIPALVNIVGLLRSLRNQAEDIRVNSGSWPTDPTHPMSVEYNMVMEKMSGTLFQIENIFKKQSTRQSTLAVINALKDSKVDYTLLLYLQLPETLRSKSELICCLESTCNQMNADYTSEYFYVCVWNHLENEGIIPVTPDKYIVANRKEDALNEYERIKKSWGKHSPLFLQTYDTKDGNFNNHLYHISRTTQDGILRLLDILKAGMFAANGKVYTACGAFEHVISPSTLTCQIYDCEIMSTAFNGGKSIEEIKEMIQMFPQCMCNIMITEDLIDIEDFVQFTVKDRTRHVNEDTVKISFHFIPNIIAPKIVHNAATTMCLKGFKDRIDAGKASIKDTGILSEGLIYNDMTDSLLSLDYSAIKSNGFTTPFSRKKKSDGFSRLFYMEELCGGMAIRREECVNTPQDLTGTNLSDKERLLLIYKQLYTTPKREMICYSANAMHRLSSMAMDGQANHLRHLPITDNLSPGANQKNGVACGPTPCPQRAIEEHGSSLRPYNSPILPAWLMSALKEVTGRDVRDVRCDLPFLKKLKETLPEMSRNAAVLHHVPSSWCANSMANDKAHVHDKNGTIFAVDSIHGVVYATCSTGAAGHKITENNSQCIKVVNMFSKANEDGILQSVEYIKGKCVHWVMADEVSMRLLVETGEFATQNEETRETSQNTIDISLHLTVL